MPRQTHLQIAHEVSVWLCAKRRWGDAGQHLIDYLRAPLAQQIAFTLLQLAARAPGAKDELAAYEPGEVWFEIHTFDDEIISDAPVRFSIEDAQRVLVEWLGAEQAVVAQLLIDEQRDAMLIES